MGKPNKFKSSILISIFKRKGGEGDFTKLAEGPGCKFAKGNEILTPGEEALLLYKKNESNWTLLTNERVLAVNSGVRTSILYFEVGKVTPGIEEEYKSGEMKKRNFTSLAIEEFNGKRHHLEIESGPPYFGIYQMLHYIATRNKIAN